MWIMKKFEVAPESFILIMTCALPKCKKIGVGLLFSAFNIDINVVVLELKLLRECTHYR